MRITTRIVLDPTGRVLAHDWFEYQGPVAELKGGNSKSEMKRANEISAQQLALQQQQLNMQMQQIAGVNAALDPLIQAGGMSPQQQAALTSITMNTLPHTFNNAIGQINQNLVARGVTGGQMAGGGDMARSFGSLAAMEGALQQQGLSGIQVQKAQQLMQALGAKMGVAGMFGQNVGGFGQQGIGALNAGVSAAGNADASQSSFMGSLIGGLAGMGSSFIGAHPCWIARAVYGEDNGRWFVFRIRFFRQIGPWQVLYLVFGKPVGLLVRRSSWLRRVFRKRLDRIVYA